LRKSMQTGKEPVKVTFGSHSLDLD
jgi:hypothetical protein